MAKMTKYELSVMNLFKKIKDFFNELDIDIISDSIDKEGGLCKYKDKFYIVVNKNLPYNMQILFILKELENEDIKLDDKKSIISDYKEQLFEIEKSKDEE